MAALDRMAAIMPAAATAEARFSVQAIPVMADPTISPDRTLPALQPAAIPSAAIAEAVTAEEVATAAVVAEAISGRRRFTRTGCAAELFPSFFRFIPV